MFPSCNEYLGADGRQAREDWRASAASRILRQTCPQICQKKLCVFATGTTLCSFVLPIRNYTVAGRKLQCAVFPKVRSWDRHSYEKFPTISPQQSGSCPTRKKEFGFISRWLRFVQAAPVVHSWKSGRLSENAAPHRRNEKGSTRKKQERVPRGVNRYPSRGQ